MFWVFFKFFVFLVTLSILGTLPGGTSYEPPGTARFPLGDEDLNNDILKNPSILEKSQKDFKQYRSNCARGASGDLQDPHVACCSDDKSQTPSDILFTTNVLKPSPEFSCKRCDLQVKENKGSVIVHCFECYDVDKSRTRDIVYLTYFLEITNYP